jgi:hypothetical protein
MKLGRSEERALRALCETFAPGGDGLPSVPELGAGWTTGIVSALAVAPPRPRLGRLADAPDARRLSPDVARELR